MLIFFAGDAGRQSVETQLLPFWRQWANDRQNPAILAYIAQTFPKAKLAPIDDPFAFAQVQSVNSYLCSTVHVAHAHKLRGYRWTPDGPA